jgi:tRNA threonylcarbamoyl adenosine modification protein YjeE
MAALSEEVGSSVPVWPVTLVLASEAETARLAEDLALILKPGHVVTLSGDLGAGKSSLARALIRALADDPALEVPSPTFTILQTYDTPRLPVAHLDLYRLSGPDDLIELGFDDMASDHLSLIEWPDRAGDELPGPRLDITLAMGATPNERLVTLAGDSIFAERIARTLAIRAFLAANGWGEATRRFLHGDAHHRTYERVQLGDDVRVLMNQPAEQDDEAGRRRKTQRRLQKRAEDTRPFHAFGLALHRLGLSVPAIHAHDPEMGLMLLEDLGCEMCVAGSPPTPMHERYILTAEVLASLHARALPSEIDDGCGGTFTVPVLDAAVLLSEVNVLIEWGVEYYVGRKPTEAEAEAFRALWAPLLAELVSGPQTWCLHDVHSPNLLWLPEREGIRKVGILDFQDTIFGPPAYDVATLARDARVTVPPDLEAAILDAYIAKRVEQDAGFDGAGFRRAYAIIVAQHVTRLLGQFVRLKVRDGKPVYMQHVPRLWAYLRQVLENPVTRPLKVWYDAVIPENRRRMAP